MGDLSASFSRFEFECECGCCFNTVDFELVMVLQSLRDHYNRPITITGGNRCKAHNMATPGASSSSMHMKAQAADFKAEGVSPRAVYKYLDKKYPNKYGLGLYNNRVHLDVREKKARWNTTNVDI